MDKHFTSERNVQGTDIKSYSKLQEIDITSVGMYRGHTLQVIGSNKRGQTLSISNMKINKFSLVQTGFVYTCTVNLFYEQFYD